MSITSMNDKFGIAVDGVIIAGIVVGIAMMSTTVVSAMAAVAFVVGAAQTLIIRNE
jgi:hypothetical protein